MLPASWISIFPATFATSPMMRPTGNGPGDTLRKTGLDLLGLLPLLGVLKYLDEAAAVAKNADGLQGIAVIGKRTDTDVAKEWPGP